MIHEASGSATCQSFHFLPQLSVMKCLIRLLL